MEISLDFDPHLTLSSPRNSGKSKERQRESSRVFDEDSESQGVLRTLAKIDGHSFEEHNHVLNVRSSIQMHYQLYTWLSFFTTKAHQFANNV